MHGLNWTFFKLTFYSTSKKLSNKTVTEEVILISKGICEYEYRDNLLIIAHQVFLDYEDIVARDALLDFSLVSSFTFVKFPV